MIISIIFSLSSSLISAAADSNQENINQFSQLSTKDVYSLSNDELKFMVNYCMSANLPNDSLYINQNFYESISQLQWIERARLYNDILGMRRRF